MKQTPNKLRAILELQDKRCALSGHILTPKDASLDHIVPLSRGGTDDLRNLQWVTKAVNKAKGTMTNDEFIDMCQAVSRYTKNTPQAGGVPLG